MTAGATRHDPPVSHDHDAVQRVDRPRSLRDEVLDHGGRDALRFRRGTREGARGRRHGSSSPAGLTRSVMQGPVSPSTMRARGTRFGSNPSASHRSRCHAATISISWAMVAIAGRNSGCRTAGLACSSRAGKRRSIGAAMPVNGAISVIPPSGCCSLA